MDPIIPFALLIVFFLLMLWGSQRPSIGAWLFKGKTNKRNTMLLYGILSFSFAVLFIANLPETNPPSAIEISGARKNLPGVVKIKDQNQINEAIAKTEATSTPEILQDWKLLLEPSDVYENPKGDGVIVWRGKGVVYLVQGDKVYAVSEDANVISPKLQKAQNLVFGDVEVIYQDRATDYERLYDACLAKVTQMRRNGVVQKLLDETRAKCDAEYGK